MASMKRLICALAICAPFAAANGNLSGFCDQGNIKATLSGLTSTNTFLGSYPQCRVQVNVHGGGLATIYSDNSGTPLANPFTASTVGWWQFYAANGRYDVVLSGGTPISLPSAWTISDQLIFDYATVNLCTGTIANTINCISPGSSMGNDTTGQTGDTDVTLLLKNLTADPSYTFQKEIRGISVESEVTYTIVDLNPGADNKAVSGINVIVSAPSGSTIYGQQDPVRSELWFQGSNPYTVNQSQSFQAVIEQLNAGVTLTNWSGFLVSPPATGGRIINGNGLTIENLDTGVGTITNPVAIEIQGINGFGQIQWINSSITQDSSENLVLDSDGSVLVRTGLAVTDGISGESLSIGSTEIINPDTSITTTALIGGRYFTTLDGPANPSFTPSCSPAEMLIFSSGQALYQKNCSGTVTAIGGGGGGGGTVTTFSAGNLVPLFTTSVLNATTTPQLTFALSNAAAFTELQNNTSSSTLPVYSGYTCVSTKTTSYSVVAADSRCLIVITDASASNLTLPATVPGSASASWRIELKALGGGTVSILRNGNNIDGGTSTPTVASGSSIAILGNGTAYWTEPGNGGSGSGACPNSTSCILAGSSATVGANTNGADIWVGTLDTYRFCFTTNSTAAGCIDTSQRWFIGQGSTSATIGSTTYSLNISEVNATIAPTYANLALQGSASGGYIDIYSGTTQISELIGNIFAGATELISFSTYPLQLKTGTSHVLGEQIDQNQRVQFNTGTAFTDGTSTAWVTIEQPAATNTIGLAIASPSGYSSVFGMYPYGQTQGFSIAAIGNNLQTTISNYGPLIINSVANAFPLSGLLFDVNSSNAFQVIPGPQTLWNEVNALSPYSVVEIHGSGTSGTSAKAYPLILDIATQIGTEASQLVLSYNGGGQAAVSENGSSLLLRDTTAIGIFQTTTACASGIFFGTSLCGIGVQSNGAGNLPTFFGGVSLPGSPTSMSVIICSGCYGPGDAGYTAGMTCTIGGTGALAIAKSGVWKC